MALKYTLAASLVIAQMAIAAECDCIYFPIRPQACVQACRKALLAHAGKADLEDKLKLDPSVADAIVQSKTRQQIQSVDGLDHILSQDQVIELKSKLDDLSEADEAQLAKKYGFGKTTTGGADSNAAVYDLTKPMIFTGRVTRMEWVNPKPYLDIKDENGKTMKFEFDSPTMLIKHGFTKNSLKNGDDVVIQGYVAKSSAKAAVAQSVTTADGKKFVTPVAPASK